MMNAKKDITPDSLSIFDQIAIYLDKNIALKYWEIFSKNNQAKDWLRKHNRFVARRICNWIAEDPKPWLESEHAYVEAIQCQSTYRGMLFPMYWANTSYQHEVTAFVEKHIWQFRESPSSAIKHLDTEILNQSVEQILKKQATLTEQEFYEWVIQQQNIVAIYEHANKENNSEFMKRWHAHPKATKMYEMVVEKSACIWLDYEGELRSIHTSICEPHYKRTDAFMICLDAFLHRGQSHKTVSHQLFSDGRDADNNKILIMSKGERRVNKDIQYIFNDLKKHFTDEQAKHAAWALAWSGLSKNEKEPFRLNTCTDIEQLLWLTHAYLLKPEQRIDDVKDQLSERVRLYLELDVVKHMLPKKSNFDNVIGLGIQYQRMLEKLEYIDELDLDNKGIMNVDEKIEQ